MYLDEYDKLIDLLHMEAIPFEEAEFQDDIFNESTYRIRLYGQHGNLIFTCIPLKKGDGLSIYVAERMTSMTAEELIKAYKTLYEYFGESMKNWRSIYDKGIENTIQELVRVSPSNSNKTKKGWRYVKHQGV